MKLPEDVVKQWLTNHGDSFIGQLILNGKLEDYESFFKSPQQSDTMKAIVYLCMSDSQKVVYKLLDKKVINLSDEYLKSDKFMRKLEVLGFMNPSIIHVPVSRLPELDME